MVDRRFARIAVFVSTHAAAVGALAQEPIVRVSVANDGHESSTGGYLSGRNNTISGDGRYVVFTSESGDLVPGDTNGVRDVFVRDVVAGTTVRVNVSETGEEANSLYTDEPVISESGRFVAFSSAASNLVTDDFNGADDIFVHDRDPDENGIFDEDFGTMERASIASDGAEANGGSLLATLSSDGNVVAFLSSATNLIAVDNNGFKDVFVHWRDSGVTVRASKSNAGGGANGDNEFPQISADGTVVVFISMATNLASVGDGAWDVFVRDLVNDVTEIVSVDANGNEANQQSDNPSISGDGRYVTFRSSASNLYPENDPSGTSTDIFVKDRLTGAVDCVTVDANGIGGHSGVYSAISADGTKVAFSSFDNFYVPADTNGEADVFIRDLATRAIVCASVNCTGVPADLGAEYPVSLSRDARYVVFLSSSAEVVSGDTNGVVDVFVNDLSNPGFQAAWTNYGAGWPGTHGVPTFTASGDPEFGATVDLLASNSWGQFAVGFVLLGFAQDSIPTNVGGTILVDFEMLIPVIVAPSGWRETVDIPYDTALCDFEVVLQMLEVDPGASDGVSFSPGLSLLFGR